MGAYPTGSELTITVVDPAIPEYWNAEALEAAYSAAVLGKSDVCVYELSKGKKLGDTYHFTELAAFTTNAVAADGAVANQSITHTARNVLLTSHREVTVTIPDRAEIQSALQYGDWFSRGAGKAIAENIDTTMFNNNTSIQGANQLGSTSGPEPMSDDQALEAVVILDDLKIPPEDRNWFFAPRSKANLLKLDKFVLANATGFAKGVQVTNQFGDLYGSSVFTSALVQNTGAPAVRKNLYMHKACMALVIERNLNIETFARVSKATTYSADVLYGTNVVRPDWGVVINTAA